MSSGRCPLHCQTCGSFSRRDFLKGSTVVLAGSSLVAGCSSVGSKKTTQEPIRQCGPASVYVPTIRAAFVRRREEYGMLWPGAVYDGDAARRTYAAELTRTASRLGARLELRPEPIYSLEEGQVWIAQAETAGVDGLMLVILDRQQHSWP
ncbi:MAG: hypothetical protein GXX98_05110, partial [Planctomycetes bacterium]|nr:hypothetical protein [Planctomycetota bacterium]